MMLLKPKTIKVKTLDNEDLEVTISRLPATVWDDLIPNFVAGQIPKVDNILNKKENRQKMLSYCEIDNKRLINDDVVNALVPDGVALKKIEWEMFDYNTGFLGNGDKSLMWSRVKEMITHTFVKTLNQVMQQSFQKK